MRIEDLPEEWDLIVIGGGATGAGILREACRFGFRTLLLERHDFAWGTSSRSSKLIHGGLRYLKEGEISLTRASVEERERLLREAPGLVEPVNFLAPVYNQKGIGRWTLKAGLVLYDIMAHKKGHRFRDPQALSDLLPHLNRDGLLGGFSFFDAQVDDARLVLRLIYESRLSGVHAHAANYIGVNKVIRDQRGRVSGVEAIDTETSSQRTLLSRVVINATGSWAESLHASPDPGLHLRPLRGSHLVFPLSVLPTAHAVSFSHPSDGRPVFVIPWEGALLLGTTDLDDNDDLSIEPAITGAEVSYLMEALRDAFPGLDISLRDCLASFAGIRPVLGGGKDAPSRESRSHLVWVDKGLVTVTGGKLTTFRRMALDALKAALPFLPTTLPIRQDLPVFSPSSDMTIRDHALPPPVWRRLCGRYGNGAVDLLGSADPEDLTTVPGTQSIWAEFPFAANYEQVRHLSDLLLRRVRIGLLSPNGGAGHLDRIQELCEPVMEWDDVRWEKEKNDYQELWRRKYSLP